MIIIIHLHNHTSGSALDGSCKVKELVSKAKQLGAEAVGISDHGTMLKVFEFYQECKEQGIKPIIGCEFYTGEEYDDKRYHILLIAKNEIGLKNLYELSLKGYSNFKTKPRITHAMMVTHNEGVICTSACIGSEIGKSMGSKTELAAATKYKEIYGDDFYLEVQPNTIGGQREYNLKIKELSNILNLKTIATCDVHYVDKEDYESHDTLLCMQVLKKKTDKDRFRFTENSFYMKTEEEVREGLKYLGEEFINNCFRGLKDLVDKCNVEIKTGNVYMPEFSGDEIKDLRKLTNIRFKERVEEGAFRHLDITEVVKRTHHELNVICSKGYAGYFLIYEDFIRFCKENDIPYGVGRGSVCGSELAFVLGITEVEPITYGLYFERFLNVERLSMPDIDGDFCYDRREEVIQYIKNKYGEENTCHILAEGTLSCKAVQRRVLSAYGYEETVIKKVSKMIPEKLGITFSEALEQSEDLAQFYESRPEEKRDILKLEGLTSHTSMHAAGIIIAPEPITNFVPCQLDRETNTVVSQWDKYIVEKIGLCKMDILGLKQLTLYDRTMKDAYKNYGIKMTRKDLMYIDYEDKALYDGLNTGDLCGIFQLSAPSAKKVMDDVKPTNFEDIMAVESICRPGVLEAELYITNAKLFRETGAYPVPEYWEYVKDILAQTYGAIVYQEQTMLLMNKLTGSRWSLGKADSMRKVKNLNDYFEDFVNCCKGAGTPEKVAVAVWKRFSLKYSFNKSHACAYGKVSMQGQYLKNNFPIEYMANNMTLELTKAEPEVLDNIKECIRKDIVIFPPDINLSTNRFEPLKEGIRMPLTCISKCGEKAVEHIIANRPYASFEDFINKVQKRTVKKNVVEMLIKAGCFDSMNPNRSHLLEQFYEIRKEVKLVPFYCNEVQIRYEYETLGFSITKHPLDGYINKNIGELTNGEEHTIIGVVKEIRRTKDKNNNEMAFISMENKLCSFTAVLFARTYSRYKNHLDKVGIINVTGKKDGSNILVKELSRA